CSILFKFFFESLGNTKVRKNILIVIFVLLSFGVYLEYQVKDPFNPDTFDYNSDVPKIYNYIRDNPEIEAIAEYPLDRLGIESDAIVYYLTMQKVHGKKILNSAAIKDVNEELHISIRDLSDPQTIPALRTL